MPASAPISRPLLDRLQDEADLCRNDGADDIAALLDEAVAALQWDEVMLRQALGALCTCSHEQRVAALALRLRLARQH